MTTSIGCTLLHLVIARIAFLSINPTISGQNVHVKCLENVCNLFMHINIKSENEFGRSAGETFVGNVSVVHPMKSLVMVMVCRLINSVLCPVRACSLGMLSSFITALYHFCEHISSALPVDLWVKF